MESSQDIQQGVSVSAPTNRKNGPNLLERVRFPQFRHDQHPPVVNVNKLQDEQLTLGDRLADIIASGIGSWNFIIVQTILLSLWFLLNSVAWFFHWDGYPFILCNLFMSAEAAFSSPVIMMSQNRQAAKDRLTADNDYKTDLKGEYEIKHVMEHLDHQDTFIFQIVERVEKQNHHIDEQEKLIVQLLQEIKEQHALLQNQRREILSVLQARPEELPAYLDESLAQEDENLENK
jgi:uncharacterized membrane protein